MNEIRFIYGQGIPDSDARNIKSALESYLRVSRPYVYLQKSASSIPEALIQLIGSAHLWLPLTAAATAAATAFGKQFGQNAGNAAWRGLSQLFSRSDTKPLAEFAIVLADAVNSGDGEKRIVVGLNIPDENWGTAIQIRSGDAEEIARVFQVFFSKIDTLEAMMQEQCDQGHSPLGRADIILQQDGNLKVRWRSQHDMELYEKTVE